MGLVAQDGEESAHCRPGWTAGKTGEGNGNHPASCLENTRTEEAWRAIDNEGHKSWTQLSN